MIYIVRMEYNASATPNHKKGVRGYQTVEPNTWDKAHEIADSLRRTYPTTFRLVWVEQVERINHLELLCGAL